MVEVGEYVRTKEYGDIGKLLKITSTKIYLDSIGYAIDKEEIKNHSKNIIDLIEVGDYVNGKLVSNVDRVDKTNIIEWDNGEMYSTKIPNDKFIKEILTKEQYEANCYKVKEE